MKIRRPILLKELTASLKKHPITALLGPRQCGKTTLARDVVGTIKSQYFDLEDELALARLQNPMSVLGEFKGVVILDEIQRRPDLIPLLRVLADRRPLTTRFLVLGSASPHLMKQASESLAGRIHFIDMSGFSLGEVGSSGQDKLWLRGGFPKSYLAVDDRDSQVWREDFIRTFLERDLRQFGTEIPAPVIRRFWTMLAHYHGQTWNGSEIAASLGVAHTTSRRYLDILTHAFMVRQLPPWFENIGKRVVKAPKVYVRDSGLLHALLRLSNRRDLQGSPKYGSSWEGFCVEQILLHIGERDVYFWGTHGGAELDLLVIRHGKRWGFEFKCSDAPTTTKSMRVCFEDLKLQHLWIVYPGREAYQLDQHIDVIPLSKIPNVLK